MSDSDIRNRIATVVLVKRDNPYEAADRILALIAEAMLSDQVVAAAADVVSNFHDYIGETGYFASGSTSEKYRLHAALAAAGITPGKGREGGENG